jgi:hypothetical protein
MVLLETTAFLRAFDNELEPLWDATATTHPGVCISRRIQRGADGDLFATGWFEKVPLPGRNSSWLARFSPDGEMRWDTALSVDCAGTDVLPTADGGAFIVESCGGKTLEEVRMAVRRTAPDGSVSWSSEIFGPYPLLRAGFRLAAGPGDDAIVVYIVSEPYLSQTLATSGLNLQAFAARIGADGAVIWQVALNSPGFWAEAARIVGVGDGRWVVAGTQYPAVDPRTQYPATLWFLDADGTIVRRVTVDAQPGDYFLVNSVHVAADGGMILAGPLTKYSGDSPAPLYANDLLDWRSDAYLMKLDASGNFEWMRLYGGTDIDNVFDAVPFSDGTITAVGVLGADIWPKTENWILRTDFWGRTCGMRLGVCADKSWQDCEDGNPCTINWCDPDEGCTAPPLPDGSPCGDGLTCQGAVCK